MTISDFFIPWVELISPKGRINRQRYLTYVLIYSVILLPIVIMLYLARFRATYSDDGLPLEVLLIQSTFLAITGYLYFCLISKRLHDLGLPAIVGGAMLALIPLIILSSFWTNYVEELGPGSLVFSGLIGFSSYILNGAGFYIFMAPGEKGDNRYGGDPLAPSIDAEQD